MPALAEPWTKRRRLASTRAITSTMDGLPEGLIDSLFVGCVLPFMEILLYGVIEYEPNDDFACSRSKAEKRPVNDEPFEGAR